MGIFTSLKVKFDRGTNTETNTSFVVKLYDSFVSHFTSILLKLYLGHGQWFTDIMTWDSLNKEWEKLTSISFGRRHHSSIIVGNYIYLLGGFIRHRDITGSFVRNLKFSLKYIYFQYVFMWL